MIIITEIKAKKVKLKTKEDPLLFWSSTTKILLLVILLFLYK